MLLTAAKIISAHIQKSAYYSSSQLKSFWKK